jgi:hypothetical protein
VHVDSDQMRERLAECCAFYTFIRRVDGLSASSTSAPAQAASQPSKRSWGSSSEAGVDHVWRRLRGVLRVAQPRG